jgi:hypothetical protein
VSVPTEMITCARGLSSGTSSRSALTSPTDTACSRIRGFPRAGTAWIFPNRSPHALRCLRAQRGAVIAASGM